MNWLLTCVFYLVLFPHYYLLGKQSLQIFNYEKNARMNILAGFLVTFFLTFIIGFPCQLFHLSWNFYFVLQLLVFIVIDGIVLFINKDKIFCKHHLDKKEIQSFFKNNWLLILFVVMFITVSISNQSSYYHFNYDEMYYISKVVNHVGTPQLMNKDYFNGSFINTNSLDLIRVINTYELSYAFFATLFNIYIPFFCRITMTLHNYILFVFVYKELASRIIGEKHSQYTILPFFLFIIPEGYLESAFPIKYLRIYSYDLWQFQGSAFFGGSLVRTLSLPLLLLFSYPLIKKLDIKKILFIIIISISLLSFSTIYLQIVILFFIVALLAKCLYYFCLNVKDRRIKQSMVYIILLCILIIVILSTKFLNKVPFIYTDSFVSNINGYNGFQLAWYNNSYLLNYGWLILVMGLITSKNYSSRVYFVVTFFLYLFIFRGYFINFLVLTSFNYYFVILRTISSVEYLLIFSTGIIFVKIFQYVFKKKVNVLNFVSVLGCFSLVLFFNSNINSFLNYNYLGSGISEDGWDFSRLLNFNTKMVPNIFSEVGDYFNSLTFDSYKLFTCGNFFTDDGKSTQDVGFMLTTNRLQISYRNGFENLNNSDIALLNQFCEQGDLDANTVHSVLLKENIDYILVFNKEAVNRLEQIGDQLVLENETNKNPYYLLKVNY